MKRTYGYNVTFTLEELNRVITCLATARDNKAELMRKCESTGHLASARDLGKQLEEIKGALRACNKYKFQLRGMKRTVNKARARKVREREEYLDWHLEYINGSTWVRG